MTDALDQPPAPPTKPSKPLPLVGILLLATFIGGPVLLRLFVFEAFKIPAGSMSPTIVVGDHVFVRKYDTEGRLGDVIVFDFPENPAQAFVKRIVAVGGDTIENVGGRLFRNGKAVPLCEVGAYSFEGLAQGSSRVLYVEHLTERGHLIMLDDKPTACKSDAQCEPGAACRGGGCGHSSGLHTVPAGEVWMAGDNRNNSYDSFAWGGGAGRGVTLAAITGNVGMLWNEADRSNDRLFADINGPPQLSAKAPAAITAGVQRCLDERAASR